MKPAPAEAAEAEATRLREARSQASYYREQADDTALFHAEKRQAAEARCAELEQERDAAMDAVGLPERRGLDDLIRHHRGNAATAAGFDQIAAEERCARLQQALAAFDPFVAWIEENHPKVLREMPREWFGAIKQAGEALAEAGHARRQPLMEPAPCQTGRRKVGWPFVPTDSQEDKT